MADPAPARPAATLLLLRDGPAGLEVCMVVRHAASGFAAGALVFPGGRVEAADAGLADPADPLGKFRVAAIRETFEECGVLLARAADGAWAGPEAVPPTADAAGFAAALGAAGLIPDAGALVPFAHWVTPTDLARRFDTHFFLAAAPAGAVPRHDGREAVESVWIPPALALDEALAGRWKLVFPTRLNLRKLAAAGSVAAAIAQARATPVVTVQPEPVAHPDGPHLRIPAAAGYGGTLFPAGDRAM